MSDVDFNAILSQSSEAEAPKPLAAGSYQAIIGPSTRGNTEVPAFGYDKSSQKGTPFVRFNVVPVAANGDVDQEELMASGGLEGKSLQLDFYLTQDARWRLFEFQDKTLGLDVTGRPLAETIPECVGQPFQIMVTHGISQKTGRPYAQIDNTMKAD